MRLNDAESFRLSVLVAHGVPRADAVQVIAQQRAARVRPVPRTVMTDTTRARVTMDDRGLVSVPLPTMHRPYRVSGVFA